LGFHGRGTIKSTDTLSTLEGILGEIGYELVLEPVSKPILEPVLRSIWGELG